MHDSISPERNTQLEVSGIDNFKNLLTEDQKLLSNLLKHILSEQMLRVVVKYNLLLSKQQKILILSSPIYAAVGI